MKLSDFISFLQEKQKTIGDVELFHVADDGRSTWRAKISPKIEYRVIWSGHSAPKSWYLTL